MKVIFLVNCFSKNCSSHLWANINRCRLCFTKEYHFWIPVGIQSYFLAKYEFSKVSWFLQISLEYKLFGVVDVVDLGTYGSTGRKVWKRAAPVKSVTKILLKGKIRQNYVTNLGQKYFPPSQGLGWWELRVGLQDVREISLKVLALETSPCHIFFLSFSSSLVINFYMFQNLRSNRFLIIPFSWLKL